MPAQMRDSWGNWVDVDQMVNAGGEQTVRLLGPYTLDFDYPNVNSEPEFFGDALAVGTLVIRGFGFVTAGFEAAELNPIVQVVIGDASDYPVLAWNADADNAAGVAGKLLVEENLDVQSPPRAYVPSGALVIGSGQKLGGVIWHDTGTLTAGSVDIYALIAEPA
jgi:hypothetical protein